MKNLVGFVFAESIKPGLQPNFEQVCDFLLMLIDILAM